MCCLCLYFHMAISWKSHSRLLGSAFWQSYSLSWYSRSFPFSVFSVVFIFSSVFLPSELHVYFQYWHSIGVFSYNESPVLVQEQSSPLVVCFSVAVCIPFGCELFVCLFFQWGFPFDSCEVGQINSASFLLV